MTRILSVSVGEAVQLWTSTEGTDFDKLEAVCVEIERRLGADRPNWNVQAVALATLGLTIAETCSIEPWCDGYGDEEACHAYPDDSCCGCRDTGFQRDHLPAEEQR